MTDRTYQSDEYRKTQGCCADGEQWSDADKQEVHSMKMKSLFLFDKIKIVEVKMSGEEFLS